MTSRASEAVRSDAAAEPSGATTCGNESPGLATECLPFGPYAGETVDAVAVMDHNYLLDLVREGVGPAPFRAAAARALARRDRLAAPTGAEGCRRSGRGAIGTNALPAAARARPWMVALAVGAVVVIMLALARLRPAALAPGPLVGGAGEHVTLIAPASGAAQGRSGAQSASLSVRRAPADAARPAASAAIDQAAPTHGEGGPPSRPSSTSTTASARPDAPTGEATVVGLPRLPAELLPCGARIEGAIPAEVTGDFTGTFQAVEFEVVRTKDTGRVTYLNSHEPYQGHFYVAVFPGDYDKFPDAPAMLFRGKCIVVQGLIEVYRGAPQIILRSPDDVRILEQ